MDLRKIQLAGRSMKTPLLFIGFALALGAAQFDSVAVTNIHVSMRDGVKLSTDIYRPANGGTPAEGRYPVLVTRTPYNKKGERSLSDFFARNGFVFVAQDVRGRYESEGKLAPLLNEPTDGYDTLEWAAVQQWSNGKVGTTGASYLAMNQLSAATLNPPHLVAMYLAAGSSNYYREAAYRGGVPSSGWPVWLLFSASTSNRAESDSALKERLGKLVAQPSPWLTLHPRERESIFEEFPDQLAAYRAFYQHPLFDEYWKQRGSSPMPFSFWVG
jgi:putative CocE/NonD family hydrolase